MLMDFVPDPSVRRWWSAPLAWGGSSQATQCGSHPPHRAASEGAAAWRWKMWQSAQPVASLPADAAVPAWHSRHFAMPGIDRSVAFFELDFEWQSLHWIVACLAWGKFAEGCQLAVQRIGSIFHGASRWPVSASSWQSAQPGSSPDCLNSVRAAVSRAMSLAQSSRRRPALPVWFVPPHRCRNSTGSSANLAAKNVRMRSMSSRTFA